MLHLLTEYDNLTMLEAEIKKAEEEVKAAANSQRLNEDYKVVQKVSRWIQVETDTHYTLCGAKNCYSSCHAPCHLTKSFNKEDFKSCASIGSNGYCKVCKHSYEYHYHNEVKHECVTEEVEMIDEETRQRFMRAKNMEEGQREILDGFLKAKKKTIEDRKKLSGKLHATIVEFQELGITRNYAKLLESQIAVIEQRLEGESGNAANDLRKVKEKLKKEWTIVLLFQHMS